MIDSTGKNSKERSDIEKIVLLLQDTIFCFERRVIGSVLKCFLTFQFLSFLTCMILPTSKHLFMTLTVRAGGKKINIAIYQVNIDSQYNKSILILLIYRGDIK